MHVFAGQWKLLPHLPYSWGLAPNDFCLRKGYRKETVSNVEEIAEKYT